MNGGLPLGVLTKIDLPEELYFLAETVKVEIISNVIVVDLDEKLVALQIAKPRNPAGARLAVIIIVKIF